ncbi:MAG: 2-deoxyribose-5-phosphate aldolase, partial [Coriobacteriaceae bacterium]|nr:2-deoxyribose-5-phosphate aldolase [Coriobacteriaceae bacterium]
SEGSGLVKVIIETGRLDTAAIARAARIACDAGAAFVKTSTGFGPRGASSDDVLTIREAIGEKCRIKASGGIRDLATALVMFEAGADRIGTSSGAEILAAAAQGRG